MCCKQQVAFLSYFWKHFSILIKWHTIHQSYNPAVKSTMRLWRVSYLHSSRRIERPDELLSLQERHLMMKAAVLGPVQCWLHFAHWDRQHKRVQTLRIHILKPSAKSSCLYGQARTQALANCSHPLCSRNISTLISDRHTVMKVYKKTINTVQEIHSSGIDELMCISTEAPVLLLERNLVQTLDSAEASVQGECRPGLAYQSHWSVWVPGVSLLELRELQACEQMHAPDQSVLH
jgi:hypothetical protein